MDVICMKLKDGQSKSRECCRISFKNIDFSPTNVAVVCKQQNLSWITSHHTSSWLCKYKHNIGSTVLNGCVCTSDRESSVSL